MNISASSGSIKLIADATAGVINLRANQVQFNGVTQWSSDANLKQEIRTVGAGLDVVGKLWPVSYH